MTGNWLGRRIAPARFVLFVAVFAASAVALRLTLLPDGADALVMGFDLGVAVFLAALWPILRQTDGDAMRRHSRDNDANRHGVLVLTSLVALVIMVALAGVLPQAKHSRLAMAQLLATLAMIWTFANTVFALHYAHCFYAVGGEQGGDTRGLDFPGTETPDYWDFIYFSFTLGMTFQTSDVEMTSGAMRRLATVQSLVAFAFNIGVIAFVINSIGGAS